VFAVAQQRDNFVAGAFRKTKSRPSPPDGERPGAEVAPTVDRTRQGP
jgi:hypothetical protein